MVLQAWKLVMGQFCPHFVIIFWRCRLPFNYRLRLFILFQTYYTVAEYKSEVKLVQNYLIIDQLSNDKYDCKSQHHKIAELINEINEIKSDSWINVYWSFDSSLKHWVHWDCLWSICSHNSSNNLHKHSFNHCITVLRLMAPYLWTFSIRSWHLWH